MSTLSLLGSSVKTLNKRNKPDTRENSREALALGAFDSFEKLNLSVNRLNWPCIKKERRVMKRECHQPTRQVDCTSLTFPTDPFLTSNHFLRSVKSEFKLTVDKVCSNYN